MADLQSRHLADLLAVSAVRPAEEIEPTSVRRLGRRRLLWRRTGGTISLVLLVAVTAWVWPSQPGTLVIDPASPGTIQAPEPAAADPDSWPIELVWDSGHPQAPTTYRFRGSSWDEWSLEEIDPATGEAHLLETQPSPGSDLPEGARLIPDPLIGPNWRRALGLGDPAVVPLSEIPGGRDLVVGLGLDADDVEAYATENVAGCSQPLPDCASAREEATRAVAHVRTGLPLYAETYASGEHAVLLAARSLTSGGS